MKKRKNFISVIVLLVSLSIVVSCKKDKPEPPIVTPPPVAKTTEQNKAILEKAGVDFVKQTELMEKNKGIETSVQMGKLLDKDDFSDGILGGKGSSKSKNSIFFKLFCNLNGFAKKQTPIFNIFKDMEYTSDIKGSKGLVDDYNQLKGIYDWDRPSETWIKSTITSDNIILNFPSTESGTINNASFSFTEFIAQTILVDGNSEEIPVSMKWNLTVDKSIVISFTYSSVYENNRPKDITSILTISPFVFKWGVNCLTTQCTSSYSISNGSQIILNFSATANGDWSESNLDTYIYHKIDSTYNSYLGIWIVDKRDSIALDKILYDANVSFAVMNIKLTGVVDFKNLYTTMNNIDKINYPSDKDEQIAIAKAINDYIHLLAINSSDNSNIATGEAYVTSKEEDYYVDLRLVFPDGSKADIETYTNQGFKAFVDEINTFMNDLALKYDFHFEPIKY